MHWMKKVFPQGIGVWVASGVQPRPLPKPPHKTPILPLILSPSSQQFPFHCTLTMTATGFNIDWKGRKVIASKKKIKEIEQAKMSCRKSVSVGTTHALEILGESTCVHPVCPLLERLGQASQFRQVKASAVHSTLSSLRRACHHHHSTRMLNGPKENHPYHGEVPP